MGIKDRLRTVIDTLGLKISEASEISGVPYRSWQNYLSGLREPNAEALTMICTRLGVHADWLLTGEGPMRREESPQPPATAVEVPDGYTAFEMSPREAALLELFRSLDEDGQREIQGAAAEKKRLSALEQRIEELAAALEAVRQRA
ncbi:DNA-binding protein [Pseudomonas sp. OF001]|uniref:helix-turn-helix domain-containing protein n=1 Tax=Pseudomonas sp. OF001 TaxID=2772300 RepID=UPI001919131E|nr:helix-turn-helix domain-containing protein [Pseudomonas sp. OF001]CAD5378996.1 DNA-binding protein [Pseudomonas sp. OF001]